MSTEPQKWPTDCSLRVRKRQLRLLERCRAFACRRGGLRGAIGLGLDDVEILLTEGLDHLLGVGWPDGPDHAGAQIFLDPVD